MSKYKIQVTPTGSPIGVYIAADIQADLFNDGKTYLTAAAAVKAAQKTINKHDCYKWALGIHFFITARFTDEG